MVSVITGDIVGSRKVTDPKVWMGPLRELLNTFGKEPKNWQFFRGDSFQLEIKNIEDSLKVAIQIKASIRSIKGMDVRMAIGMGDKIHDASKVTESNGQAFIYSGELFEKMKKRNLALKTPWEDFDKQFNLYLDLALLTMDRWTQNSAELVKTILDMPEATQKELGKKLKITQGRISDRQRRAGLDEILKLEKRFRELVKEKI